MQLRLVDVAFRIYLPSSFSDERFQSTRASERTVICSASPALQYYTGTPAMSFQFVALAADPFSAGNPRMGHDAPAPPSMMPPSVQELPGAGVVASAHRATSAEAPSVCNEGEIFDSAQVGKVSL